MKKLLITLFGLGLCAQGYSQKITALPANTAPVDTDITVMVDDPGGSAATEKVTMAVLKTYFQTGLGTTANAVHSTLNLTGANTLGLGSPTANTGSINFKNSTNSEELILSSGVTTTGYTFTLPVVAAAANGAVLFGNTNGTTDFTKIGRAHV